ncbi:MAG: Holliday junction branch migration protein RuvA [Burkholderiales bacterium]|nr:Holliday junction branch migration protein RuvA [Pseudomonadota bacterium]MCZ2136532.1 Holliday junction branch migration protein RuvA [Burkholderiales bacterium]
MIARLSGQLVAKHPPQIVIDVGGVGYELDVPMSTFYALPATGEAVRLLTHQVVREDAHLLFGFATEDERSAFRQLIRVTGIGPKVALAVLSGLSVEELNQAIVLQDVKRLTRVPGIGNKTAERLLLELKGKVVASAAPGQPAVASANRGGDVVNALLALGYGEKEAAAACRELAPELPLNDAIRQALRLLSKTK